jgi:transposase
MKLNQEARMTIRTLAGRMSQREIAKTLGVTEGAVRYHLRRAAEGSVDGRSRQPFKAASYGEAIDHYLEIVGDDGPINLADLHDWLVAEHDYRGSLRSLQRYFRRHYPKPRVRARRRVETPPGAQAQVDWAVWPEVRIGGRVVRAYEFVMRLGHSRMTARVWAPRKDQLSWHSVHNDAFRFLGGVPATVRVDNEKTAMSRGAGPWGERNPSYLAYAHAAHFHIDACLPRHPQAKGKVERGTRDDRAWARTVLDGDFDDWTHLQSVTDARCEQEAHRRICPATGTTVFQAWQAERAYLQPLPLLPEPFDLVRTATVAHDCTVGFENRRYSVPFALLGQRVEVHGCTRTVQVLHDGHVVAEHPRRSRERIVIDPRHYEGESTDRVVAPMPLGRMGQRLQQIQDMPPQARPIDLYAALAEVAR